MTGSSICQGDGLLSVLPSLFLCAPSMSQSGELVLLVPLWLTIGWPDDLCVCSCFDEIQVLEVGSAQGRLLPQGRRFAELAGQNGEIDVSDQIDEVVREIQAGE